MKRRNGGDAPPYSEAQATAWLSWLARGMQWHGQTIFLIEQLKATWLTTRAQFWIYILTARLLWGIVVGLIGGLIVGLLWWPTFRSFFGAAFQPFFGLVFGLIVGLIVGLIGVVRTSRSRWPIRSELDIFPGFEQLIWSVLLFSLIGTLGPQMAREGQIRGLIGAGLIGGLLNCFREGFRGLKPIPNQGIWLSVRSACLMGSVGGLGLGLIVGLWRGPATGLTYGVLGSLCIGMWYGGLDVIQHGIVRLLLVRQGVMPWNYARFLDYAAEELNFLQKVGSGYMFVHRYLLEYFAAMEQPDQRASAGAQDVAQPAGEAVG